MEKGGKFVKYTTEKRKLIIMYVCVCVCFKTECL